MKRLVFETEHEQLRETAKQFLEKECLPNVEKWEANRLVDREAYVAAGNYGLIGFNMPEEYGGGGVDDFRFNAVIVEEFSKFGLACPGVSLQNDIVGPYFKHLATQEQLERWMPGFASGELMLESEQTPLAPAQMETLGPRHARLTLTEGRYHQVRRMFAAVGNHVEALHRERLGGLTLPADLAPGAWRLLTPDEIASIFVEPA